MSQYDELNILGRLDNKESQLANVLAELISLSHFITALDFWIRNNYQESSKSKTEGADNEKTVVDIKLLFTIFQHKNPPASKYDEVIQILDLLANDTRTKSVIKSHMLWLINATNWNDKSSVDITISKLKILEKICRVDNELKENLRTKIGSTDVDILKSILSDESRDWITNHLGKK